MDLKMCLFCIRAEQAEISAFFLVSFISYERTSHLKEKIMNVESLRVKAHVAQFIIQ